MKFERLETLSFFTGLSAADLRLLAPYFAPHVFAANTTIFEQGDRADYLYLVVSGDVIISYKPDDGPIMTVTHVQPGGIFGWSAAMGNPSYTSAASCGVDSEVVRIRGADLRVLCDKNPEVGKVILSRLAAVIAERKKSQQRGITTLLANGLLQQGGGPGAPSNGKKSSGSEK